MDGKNSDNVSFFSSGGSAEKARGNYWSNPSARHQSDDGLYCGSEIFQEKLVAFSKRFPFGNRKKITFIGLHIKQHDNFSITINQQQYIKDIQPISLIRARRMQQKDVVNKRKKQNLRGLIRNLLYGVVNTRPDLCSHLG